MPTWKKITDEHPPTKKVLKTKIVAEDGSERMEQELILDNGLWWLPDKSMYVYYTPTHWWCYI